MDNKLIAKLSKTIEKKHKSFLKIVGDIPYKVSADYAWLLTDTTTKLTLIATLLRDQEVIDHFEVVNLGEYNEIELSKNGLDFRIIISTNGTLIKLTSANGMLANFSASVIEWVRPEENGWNWEEFLDKILDFIHMNMYRSQQAEEINFDAFMRGTDD